MAIFIKLLPAIVLIWFVWMMATASSRAASALRRRSEPIGDWSLQERVRLFETTLGVGRFDLRLFPMEQVNAIASPNGDIYLSKGLYDQYLAGGIDRDEVSAIIAHEIGHVALGHHVRRLDAWRVETAAMAAALVFLAGRALFGWVGLLGAIGLKLARARLSRNDEFEADAFSAQIMMRSGLDPRATLGALKKAELWSGLKPPSGLMALLVSHPPMEERMAALKEVIAAGLPEDARPVAPQADAAGG